VTLQVALVVPEGEIWAGPAERVIAKTLEGNIGILSSHPPVLAILAEGSIVRILPDNATGSNDEVIAAVGGGFLSVADDQVSILARQAQLGTEVDKSAARTALESPDGADSAEARYGRALLQAAGDPT